MEGNRKMTGCLQTFGGHCIWFKNCLQIILVDQTTTILRQLGDLRLDEPILITDMAAVTPDTLLISSAGFSCVQLLDSRKGQLLCKVQFQDKPGTMCRTDRNTAAVCVGEDEIQMIQVKDKTLTLGKVVAVGKHVLGITFSRNTLVVSYRQKPWLEKISMDGKVLKQFAMRKYPRHFKAPEFMCSTPGGSVFISDHETNRITQVDASLNLLQTFTSPLLKKPHGIIAVTEDQILVCSPGKHSIVLLQPSTNTMSILLGEEDEARGAYSLAYCPDQKKLFVAIFMWPIKVYQIAWNET